MTGAAGSGGERTPPAARRELADPADEAFVARVMWFWRRGYDTRAIALELMQRECVIALAVRLGREGRRAR